VPRDPSQWLPEIFGPRIRCDTCEGLFRPTLTEEKLPEGGFRRFFVCPKCDKFYGVIRVTARGEEIVAMIQRTKFSDRVRLQLLREQLSREITDDRERRE